MPTPAFDRFYRYDELTDLLRAYARDYPALVALESIGKSHEGRDIWAVTVTSTATGPASDKPAFWVDGNIHATEVAASAANLYFLHTLVTQYGKDADITRALDTRAFYLCPRINPDGAEWALADQPKWIRSSTRVYPTGEEELDGLTVRDIDGDGRILQMRIPDPNGPWKAHPDEPRLMVRRDPTEVGGTYYRIVPEGTLEGYDGYTLRIKRPLQGLDLNRNFPASWRQEFEQMGAGPYPTSEPEVRAVVDFIARHGNITGGTSFHTWSGLLLRPFEHQPDEEMHAEDLWVYQAAGKKGTELTGYPHISVYHEFRYHPKSVIGGTFDWIYEHLGIFSWTVEIWSPMREAGIADYKYTTGSAITRSRTTSRSCAGATRSWAVSRTSRGGRSTIRSSAASRSAGGTASTRSRIRRRRCSSASSRASRAGSCGRRCCRRCSRPSTRRPRPPATVITTSRWSCRMRATCRRTCRSARSIARSCAA